LELNWRQRDDGAAVIVVDGELDLLTAPQLKELLVKSIERDSGEVTTIDFAGCTFVDSTGIGVIVDAGHLLEEKVKQLRIINLHDQPKQVFELTLVDRAPFIEVIENASVG
jgi:anti-anti-sigma factor